MHVRKVRKPSKAAPTPFTEHHHPPGGGKLITVQTNDSVASELWATAMRSTYEFVQEIYDGSGDGESPATTLRRCLASLLATAEVQGCLEDVGFSVDELRVKLGERD